MQELYGVHVFFNGKLMLGTAVVKVNSIDFDAFDSPRHMLVGKMRGDRLVCDQGMIENIHAWKKYTQYHEPFWTHKIHQEKVGIIYVYPGIDLSLYKLNEMAGIVLVGLGSGNGPTKDKKFVDAIGGFLMAGKPVAVCSDCLVGSTSTTYATSIPVRIWFIRILVFSNSWVQGTIKYAAACESMTVEAAYAKMHVLLESKASRRCTGLDRAEKLCKKMCKSWAGEIAFDTFKDWQTAAGEDDDVGLP
jgi:L-asparaginase/Glu-tRNA(Gln) amidotransferase subunit D